MGCAQKSETKRKRTFTDNAKKQQGGWRERDTEMDNTGDDVESSRCSLADGNPVSKPNKEVVDPEADAERDQRTVYVSGIPLRASREEVNLFFSSVCKVRNIDLMLDPSLRVPNAVGGVYSTHFLVSRTAQAGISLSYNDINDLDGSYCQVLNLA